MTEWVINKKKWLRESGSYMSLAWEYALHSWQLGGKQEE